VLFFFLYWISLIIPVLVNVAFFTLIERKILGLAQRRKGPNKVRILGILQPFADAIKLFTKEVIYPWNRWQKIFFISPILALLVVFNLWIVFRTKFGKFEFKFSLLIFLLVLRLRLYPLLLAGWASISNYASVGALRGVAQTISYEIRIALLLIRFFFLLNTLNWSDLGANNTKYTVLFRGAPTILALIICFIAETNRTPFDFAEGESELVSGFNVEYGGGQFALIFMAEYASILVLSSLSSILILGDRMTLYLAIFAISLRFLWVWIRATLPRFRYDKLIKLAWTSLLPISLGLLIFCFSA
jgi:NADH-ubiquinone oxidoreductase chain 1